MATAMTSAELLQAGRRALQRPRFNPREPRVSVIGLCARRQVARALGQIDRIVPYRYDRAGHDLQHNAFLEMSSVYDGPCELAPQEEVCVQTPIPGVWCHPDIIIPASGECLQVKTRKASSPKWGDIRPYDRDQCLMEWVSWSHFGGYCCVEDAVNGDFVPWVPEKYRLLYLDRETYGELYYFASIHFDPARARVLEAKFWDIAAAIEFEQLPAPVKCWECYKCELRKECWE